MQFQNKLIDKINNLIESKNLPKTIMLEGGFGCGKRTLAQEIANKLDFEFLDITGNLNLETIENITLSVTPRVYYIDGTKITVKEQNIILKFLEEPLKTSYIILACENRNSLLNTVINRCVVFEFETYTKEQLKTFLEDGMNPNVLYYADTPGRVKQFASHDVDGMATLSTKILTQVKDANYSNILKIPNNINFSDKSELFDFDTFTYILIFVACELYKRQQIPFKVFEVTSQFYKDCSILRINKLHLFEHYLISLKRVFEGV